MQQEGGVDGRAQRAQLRFAKQGLGPRALDRGLREHVPRPLGAQLQRARDQEQPSEEEHDPQVVQERRPAEALAFEHGRRGRRDEGGEERAKAGEGGAACDRQRDERQRDRPAPQPALGEHREPADRDAGDRPLGKDLRGEPQELRRRDRRLQAQALEGGHGDATQHAHRNDAARRRYRRQDGNGLHDGPLAADAASLAARQGISSVARTPPRLPPSSARRAALP